MKTAHQQFKDNFVYIRELDNLYHHLKYQLQLPNDLSDLLRAEIVYAISALDKLVHELIRLGMLETFNGKRTRTSSFERFVISNKTMEEIKRTSIERSLFPTMIPSSQLDLPEYWFEQEVILKHKANSYQDPKKISEGLSLIWNEGHKWQKIAKEMPLDKNAKPQEEKVIVTQLELIVNIRNNIVHEAGIDFQTGKKHIIDENDTQDMINFIEYIGDAIYKCVS